MRLRDVSHSIEHDSDSRGVLKSAGLAQADLVDDGTQHWNLIGKKEEVRSFRAADIVLARLKLPSQEIHCRTLVIILRTLESQYALHKSLCKAQHLMRSEES